MNDGLSALDKMRLGVEYSFKINLRGYDVLMRPLANSELTKCYNQVATYIAQLRPEQRTKIIEDNALAREFLKAASSPFDNFAPQITDPILDRMTTDEIMYLYKEWLAVCDRVNPQLEKIPLDRIKELVDEVKKSPPKDLDFQLTQLSFGQLVNIAHYLLTKDG